MNVLKPKTIRLGINFLITIASLGLVALTIPDMKLVAGLLVAFWITACVAMAVSESLEKKPLREVIRWTTWTAIIWGLLFIGEYRLIIYENSPHLSGEITLVAVGTREEFGSADASPDAYFTVSMTLKNDGVPTTISKWSADVLVPGLRVRHAHMLTMQRGVHHVQRDDGVDIQYSGDEDDLEQKVREVAFGPHARPWGYLQFVVKGLSPIAPRTKDTVIRVTFADDEGHQGSAERVMTGHQLDFPEPGPQYQHGTKTPLPKQP